MKRSIYKVNKVNNGVRGGNSPVITMYNLLKKFGSLVCVNKQEHIQIQNELHHIDELLDETDFEVWLSINEDILREQFADSGRDREPYFEFITEVVKLYEQELRNNYG